MSVIGIQGDDAVSRGFALSKNCRKICFPSPHTFEFVNFGKPAARLISAVKTPAARLSGHGHSDELSYFAQHRVKLWCPSDGRCRLQFSDGVIRYGRHFI